MELQVIELEVIEPETLTIAPAAPVLAAADCPGYGRELPGHWRCPTCAVAEQCFEAMLTAQRNGNGKEGQNGQSRA